MSAVCSRSGSTLQLLLLVLLLLAGQADGVSKGKRSKKDKDKDKDKESTNSLLQLNRKNIKDVVSAQQNLPAGARACCCCCCCCCDLQSARCCRNLPVKWLAALRRLVVARQLLLQCWTWAAQEPRYVLAR